MNKQSIYKKAFYLALPMMIQSGITNAVGLVDNLMVGSLGTESITAVSISTQLIFVYAISVFGALSGPSIYTAQYYGYGDTEGVRKVFRLKWWVAGFCMLVGALVFLFFSEQIITLYLLGESADIDAALTLSLAKDYIRIMLIGLVPFSISQIYASHLRETGDSVKPMVSGICSVVFDIAFNYILIFGHFGFPALGVRGAAIATVLSRIIEFIVIVVWSHMRKDMHLFLVDVYKTFLIPRDVAKKIIVKGLPIYINEFLWSGGIAVLTQCYSLRGLEIVAGLNISNAICNLLNVTFVSLGGAVGIVIGQLLGAGDFKNAKSGAIKLTWFTGAVSAVVAVFLIAISGIFPEAYNTTDVIKDYGKYFIIITALFFPVQGIFNSLYFVLRSGGKTIVTFLFDSVFTWLITIPIAYYLCLGTNLSVLIIYTTIMAADIIKILVGYVLVKKGVWVTNLVDEIQ